MWGGFGYYLGGEYISKLFIGHLQWPAPMADPTMDIVIAGLTVALSAAALVEIRFLRVRRSQRTPKDDFLPDKAHNALVTTRTISQSLAERGIVSPAAEDLLAEAETASGRGNYRVALDTLDRARGILLQETRRHESVAAPVKSPGESTPTAAEGVRGSPVKGAGDRRLQASFAIASGRRALEARGPGAAGGAAQALAAADRAFEAGDFDGALAAAQKARKELGTAEAVGASPKLSQGAGTCARCGAPVGSGGPLCTACEEEILGGSGEESPK